MDGIPLVVQGGMGGHFCDFYYEIDKVVVGNHNHNKEKNAVTV